MSLYSICDSIQSSGLMTHVRETAWVYPIVMSIHLVCIALFGGMILMTDLRLLGVGGGAIRPWRRLWAACAFQKRIGFVVIVTCGLLLAGSEAPK